MADYIAHASIDERGKAAGGSAGDQTAKEVCIRTWYNKNWDTLIRLNDNDIRITAANNMIDIANNKNIGYDQGQRNTLLTQAEKVDFDFTKITTKCECDCSSAVTISILGAIHKIKGKTEYEKAKKVLYSNNKNCCTTSTIKKALVSSLKIAKAHTSSSYTRSTKNAIFGDIYLKTGSHIVTYITSGKKQSTSKTTDNDVKNLQHAINLDLKPKPLLEEDNKAGSKTKEQMKKVLIKKPAIGSNKKYPNITKFVQKKIGATADGDFGSDSKKKTITYQKSHKLEADGIVGYNTLMSMIS